MNTEQEAKNMGWAPREEWRGDPEQWVDAETFVERGNTVMPILKANNRRLESRLAQSEAHNRQLHDTIKSLQDSVGAMEEVFRDETKRKVEETRKSLLKGLKDAKETGDIDTEVDITDKLSQLREAELESKQAKPAAPQGQPQGQPQLDPEFLEWHQRNPWYGVDDRKSRKAMGIVNMLRSDPDNDDLVGKAFYDRLDEEMGGGPAPTKVAEAATTGGRSGGQSYADLPADAKAACSKQAKRLVGPDKLYKTEADWQKAYARIYFEGEE